MKHKTSEVSGQRGFTLLEVTMVVFILAIVSTLVILVINPAEILARTRDAQRISDIAALIAAIEVYQVEAPNPSLGGGTAMADPNCLGDGGSPFNISARIFYSVPESTINLNDRTDPAVGDDAPEDADWAAPGSELNLQAATNSDVGLVDGSGWLPMDFTSVDIGSPISNLPLDPVNTVALVAGATNTDFVYRYACDMSGPPEFEINAVLESNKIGVKMAEDGGDNDNYYEAGKSLRLLPPGPSTDF